MRPRLKVILITFFLSLYSLYSFDSFAYKLVIIKTISQSQQSFITNLGKSDGISEGAEATFTTNNTSFVAIANTVTRSYSQWTLANKQAIVPFSRDQVVTYNRTTEHVWTLMPQHIVDEFEKKNLAAKAHSIYFRTSLVQGLSQSTSSVDNTGGERGGLQLDLIYEFPLNQTLAIGGGLRYEQESIAGGTATFISTKIMIIGEMVFYLPEIKSFYNSQIYAGGSIGYGNSTTSLESYSQSGTVRLIPGAKIGITFPFNGEYDLMVESGFEAINVEEITPDGDIQTTDQTNAKFSIALRKFL